MKAKSMFIGRAVFVSVGFWCGVSLSFAQSLRNEQADLVVIGATPGGIGAAVAAARLGHKVVLAEYEDHIGGIVTNGLTNADIVKRAAVGGLYYEFTRRVVKYYEAFDKDTPGAPNVKACRDGYHYEASVAERLFQEMLAGEGARIQLRLRQELKEAVLTGDRLIAVVLEDLARPGQRVRIDAPVFIDATYEGDLAAAAKTPFRVGRESRNEYGEPHAGRVYVRFGEEELLPGSTGDADDAIQAFCFRFHVTNVAANRVTVEKPAQFNRDDYRFVLEDIRSGKAKSFRQIIQVLPMPNGKFELNSDHPHPDTGVPSESFDLAEENWGWPEASPAKRRALYQRYLSYDVGLLWLLQNDPEVPAKIRDDARQFGWPRDEWAANGHMPRQVYVRQGRRIVGEYVLTERDGDLDAQLGRTRLQPTSIGVVEWSFDSHGCHRYDPAHPGVREGYIMIKHEPLQVPYGVIVPRKVDGLLVPVACSCSHVAYNGLRMEPVFVALGEAAGIAAHVAIQRGVPVRRVPLGELQQLLVSRGGVITYYGDLKFDSPSFAAFQWLGARGLNPGYEATPAMKLTRRDGWTKLRRILNAEGKRWQEPQENPQTELRGCDVAEWLRQAGFAPADADFQAARDLPLDLACFAELVYRTMTVR